MYCILMDAKTGSYYMEPGDLAFHAYSDPSKVNIRRKNSRVVETDIEDINELETQLYNAGFFQGYLDGKLRKLSKQKVYYYNRNSNEIYYAQYLLTGDKKYLELIKKHLLVTLCKIDNTSIYFPTIQTENDERAVLTYTDAKRMPQKLLEKYEGWRKVKMTFDARCIVNGEFVAE